MDVLPLGCYRDEMPEGPSMTENGTTSTSTNSGTDYQRRRRIAMMRVGFGRTIPTEQQLASFYLDIKRKSGHPNEIEEPFIQRYGRAQKRMKPPECIDDGHVHYTLEQPAEGSYEDEFSPSRVKVLRMRPSTVDNSAAISPIALPAKFQWV